MNFSHSLKMGKIFNKGARLIGVKRAFGGDIAVYETSDGIAEVFVDWALLRKYHTEVRIEGKPNTVFNDEHYVQPAEALSRMGYVVSGTVDFAHTTEPVENE